MAKEVIILNIDGKSTPGVINIRYLLWLTTPTPVTAPNFISQWSGVAPAETTALQAGTTIEENYFQSFPATLTKAQIQAFLQAHFTARQNFFATAVQPGQFFGVFFDSVTGWSA